MKSLTTQPQPIPGAMIPLPRASRQPRPDSHVLALEEVRVHGLEHLVVIGAGLLVAGLLGWASLTHLPEVAVGLGEVVPSTAAAPVQHLEGGIVSAVMVEEGELVVPGQPILQLNGATADTEMRQARLKLESLQLQARRLIAAADGNMAGLAAPVPGLFVAPQQAALDARLRLLADKRTILVEQAAQRRNELTVLAGQISALEGQIALYAGELATREELARSGLATRVAVLEATRLLLSARAERERLAGQRGSTRSALAEAEARIAELQSTAVDEARQEAARVALDIAETAEALRRLEDRADRVVLRAPIGGVLRGLAVHRPGAVLPPGGLVAEIMPQDMALVADVRLSPRDIGFIAVGQPVNLKVQAFDYARFGTIGGQVERISPGTFLDEHKQPHYRARIRLSQQHVGHDPRLARLTAGMTLQADITTGAKTVLQYLLKPIYSAMAASFHER
ncbi:HlyD family type I secretion periplasmic adaptor subunit [Teichococcus oryzae]|nr:HlyD family type I secretion periplasmic adaptor subunit [Pseudoroseomonas oryzae]